jgi:hypothetical protein
LTTETIRNWQFKHLEYGPGKPKHPLGHTVCLDNISKYNWVHMFKSCLNVRRMNFWKQAGRFCNKSWWIESLDLQDMAQSNEPQRFKETPQNCPWLQVLETW